MQRRQNARVERVARADRIGDGDLAGGGKDRVAAGEGMGAGCTFGHEDDLRPLIQHLRGEGGEVALALKPVQVLIRQFHQIGQRDHPGDPGAIGRFVGDEAGADIGVDHGDAGGGLPRHQRLIGAAAGIDDKADAAEKHRADIVRQGGHILGPDHAAGGVFVIERIACLPVDQLDEGQRRGPGRADRKAAVDLRGGQAVGQDFAEKIGGQAGQKARGRAEPPQRDGGVEDRTPGIGRKGGLSPGRLPGQHVDQRFAATQDHLALPLAITPMPYRRPPVPAITLAGGKGGGQGWLGRSTDIEPN